MLVSTFKNFVKLLEKIFLKTILRVGDLKFSIHHVHKYNPEICSSSQMILKLLTEKGTCLAVSLCCVGASSEQLLDLKTGNLGGSSRNWHEMRNCSWKRHDDPKLPKASKNQVRITLKVLSVCNLRFPSCMCWVDKIELCFFPINIHKD